MDWFAIDKLRNKFNKFIDRHNLSRQDLVRESRVSSGTIS